MLSDTTQIAILDDARNISDYLEPETVNLILTSPPYPTFLIEGERTRAGAAICARITNISGLNNTVRIPVTWGHFPLKNLHRK